jgi:hypothetical protein
MSCQGFFPMGHKEFESFLITDSTHTHTPTKVHQKANENLFEFLPVVLTYIRDAPKRKFKLSPFKILCGKSFLLGSS